MTTVSIERRNGTAVVILRRPEAANALSRALVADLGVALAELGQDLAVRAVVVTGAGDKAFCAGADLKERRGMSLGETRAFLVELNRVVDTLAALPQPTIAAINGVAFGGGLELCLACDLRLAAATATLGLTETRLGIIPGAGGTQRLARLCGPAVAKELIFTGRRLSAEAARATGIVGAVTPPEGLLPAALALGEEIAGAAPLAVRQAKLAIDEGLGRPLAEGLGIERGAYEVVLESADRDEGLASFAEKRPPRWSGK